MFNITKKFMESNEEIVIVDNMVNTSMSGSESSYTVDEVCFLGLILTRLALDLEVDHALQPVSFC